MGLGYPFGFLEVTVVTLRIHKNHRTGRPRWANCVACKFYLSEVITQLPVKKSHPSAGGEHRVQV